MLHLSQRNFTNIGSRSIKRILHNSKLDHPIIANWLSNFSNCTFSSIQQRGAVMPSSEQDTNALQDKATANETTNSGNNVDDDLKGLETQFQNIVHLSTSTKIVNNENDDATNNEPSVVVSKTRDKIQDETTKIDAFNEEIEQLSSQVESLMRIPSSTATKSLTRIATLIMNAQRILVLSGAGVSVAAGIPDFRTPGTGLYDNLKKYNLPYAEAVFDIQYYQINPHPFIQLASELWTDRHRPTITHSFIALLAKKQQLLRNYTQNIDGLERLAGVPEHLLVECHGHFRTARCIRCKEPSSIESVKECIINRREVPICTLCTKAKASFKNRPAYIKPDIVFFGEQLPNIFYESLSKDVNDADLCIILGTSLQVPPTAHIPDMVQCNRILLNRELVGNFDVFNDVDDDDERTDVFHPGDCDDSIMSIAHLLGWDNELRSNHSEVLNCMNLPGSATNS